MVPYAKTPIWSSGDDTFLQTSFPPPGIQFLMAHEKVQFALFDNVWDRGVVNDGTMSCGTSPPLPHMQSLQPPAQLQSPKILAAIPPGHEHGRVAVQAGHGGVGVQTPYIP